MSMDTPSAYKGFNLDAGDRILFFLKIGVVALVFLTFGVGATAILTGAACAAMAYEWFRMTTGGRDFDEPIIGIALIAGALPPFATFAVGAGGGAALACLASAFFLIMGPKQNGMLAKTALGLAVIGLAGVCFVWMRDHGAHGLGLTAWLIFVAVASEAGGTLYALTKAEDREPPHRIIPGVVCGVIAGCVAAAFYRSGNPAWVIVTSLITALVVVTAGMLTQRIRHSVDTAQGGSLFMGRGAVIEQVDGLVWASLFAGALMMVTSALFGIGVLFDW